MGSRIDGIESEIKQRRSTVEARVSSFRDRVEDDVTSVQAEAQARVDKVVGDAKDAVHGAAEKVGLEEKMRDHPYPVLAAGVGAGALLGFITGGGDSGEEQYDDEDDSPGLLSSLLSPITGVAVEKLRSEVQGLVRDRIGDLVDSVKSRTAQGAAGAEQQL